jgi:TonB dependent receptor/Carboxypeptidase regulatory-like domain/TonB-dependent Receptor Plug Domain
MKRFWLWFTVFLLTVLPCYATIFGTVRGVVHDPQHRPIANAQVMLKARASDFTQTTQTDANGEFQFNAVPLAEYEVTVSLSDFASQTQAFTVLSGTAPVLHFELKLAGQSQSITVSALPAQAESVTPTTVISRDEIRETPGATRANSLALITEYVPGAYFTHDQLHVRGGHQVSWLIDGVPIPNTNIASNLGPQIDPKDIDTLEIQRGSYSSDFGDRTYGVFNVAPRTGFERNNEAELTTSFGNFYQTDDQLNLGAHTQRFAYYASVNGNRTNLGLQTPTSAVIHDAANGVGGFGSLIYNLDSHNQLRLVAQIRRDFYQVPFDPNVSPGTFLQDANRENDSYAAFSWVHTFSPAVLLTVSPFFHHNRANYESSPNDTPTATTQDRSSNYAGGQATIAYVKGHNNARAGIYGFGQQDDEVFGLTFQNPTAGTSFREKESVTGSAIALFAEEQFRATSWLTLNAGIRQTHFSGGVVENASNPRVGAAVRVPWLNWVFRGFYGRFYQPPPLVTVSGPVLQNVINGQGLSFIPLRGERDEESQFGLTIPLKSWTLDADTFHTRAKNFFDHNNLQNSNIFLPITVDGALIRGWELTLRSPRIKHRGQLYLTYSNQVAQGRGCISGGLVSPCTIAPGDFFQLDHDQRNTLHVGGNMTLPWHAYASTDVYYASGFSNGNPPPFHLPPHTTFDMTLGKDFGERFSVSLSGINVANRRVLLDNSFTFGGTHFLNPREVFVQLRYRFHY